MRWRSAALIMATVLVATSCSGDDDTAATTVATTLPSTTTAAATTTAAPSTTDAPTTDPSTIPSTTTSADTTTEPTVTEPTVTATTPPSTSDVDERFAVIEAVEAGMLAVLDAVRDPRNDAKVAALDRHFTGTLLEGWQNVVSEYRDKNYREIENTEQPDAFLIELASIAVNEAGTFATVQGCEITSGIVVEVGGNADGSDLVIEDGISRIVIELDVVDDNGDWKISEVVEPDESDRIASCE